jgi:archaellum biogenesis ATPase FlaH
MRGTNPRTYALFAHYVTCSKDFIAANVIAKIKAAKHPKSFIILDSVDHLLSRHSDAQYESYFSRHRTLCGHLL